jgi:hypothetical protein
MNSLRDIIRIDLAGLFNPEVGIFEIILRGSII